jgi:hypothetical protein
MNIPYVAQHEQEARGFLRTLFTTLDADEQIELRWKPPNDGVMRRGFSGDSQEVLHVALNLGTGNDVYVGVAPRRGQVGTKEGVTRLLTIWADLDAKDGHTHEDRLKQLMDLPYRPSMLVWSGGGWHVYWLLEEAVEGQETLNRAEVVMQRLGEGLGGDPVHDLPRILRVPGTFNHKYGSPRPVELVHCDSSKRYPLDQLQKMAEALPREEKVSAGGKVPRDVLNAPIREQRNVALTSVGGSLRDRGCDEETIHVVLLEVNRLRCEPPLEDAEVRRIAKSVGRYPSGSPRYRKSSATRVYRNGRAA